MSKFSNTWNLEFTKNAVRALRANKIDSQLTNLINATQNKSLSVKGWTFSESPVETAEYGLQNFRQGYGTADTDSEVRYVYNLYARVTYASDIKPYDSDDLRRILNTIARRAVQPNYGEWNLTSVNDEAYEVPEEGQLGTTAEMLAYTQVTIPDNWADNFSHLYGLDPHVTQIHDAMTAGISSDWDNRFHCALIGPPGCGKSDICRSIKRALGEDAVLEFDATATTAAGAIKELSEREILPRVMIIEEIEKADPESLKFLLALTDLRGEIRKTTARATIQRDTKLFVICTVNDLALFNKLQAGALSSRFMNKIGFRRPTRDMLAMILQREVNKVNGDHAWIQPALDYCEANEITDPRRVTAICLCGRDKLVTGEYQKMLEATKVDEDELAARDGK